MLRNSNESIASRIQTVSNHELVPGDIIVFHEEDAAEPFYLPCDMVLLTGKCVANESILTGESVPVIKLPIEPDSD